MAAKPRILVADDQVDVLEALRLLLKAEGCAVETVTSPSAAVGAIEKTDFDCVMIDLNYTRDTTSGKEGLELIPRLRALDQTLPVVVMTAWGSVDGAVEAMRAGARDYVEKPWDNERLLSTVRTQVELARALRKTQRLEGQARRSADAEVPRFVAESRAMRPVIELVDRIGPSDANVLITGEHGTGKEVVARHLHAVSSRRESPFVAVNAGGFSEGVFESELFGHVKGAFTDARTDRVGCFEMADGGTLFLDEIANVPVQQQAKLLRVLQTGEIQRVGSTKVRPVDVRLLSATNADIEAAVADGSFREDLLYRLNTVEIRIPPLRDRGDDILPLARHFLARERERYGRPIEGFSPEAERALEAHAWPGNVRELEHAIERAVLMCRGDAVSGDDLGLRSRAGDQPTISDLTLAEADRLLVAQALEKHGGNVTRAAEELDVSRAALYRRMERYGL